MNFPELRSSPVILLWLLLTLTATAGCGQSAEESISPDDSQATQPTDGGEPELVEEGP
ncbi:MAG: hypothetical protein ACYTGL_12800 [Planctomycetota bacterium]|jgi:hypothetical protein